MLSASGLPELLLLTLGLCVGLPVLFILARRQKDARRSAWDSVAQARGLSFDGEDVIEGAIEDFAIRVGMELRRSGDSQTRVTVITLQNGLPTGLELGAEGLLSRVFGADTPIGDRDFDAEVHADGDDIDTLLALDSAGRGLVREAIAEGWRLADGKLARARETSNDALGAELDAGVEFARLLREAHANVAPRLLERLRGDPEPAVRRRIFDLLVGPTATAFVRYGETVRRKALETALQQPDRELRLEAASRLGDSDALVRLADEGSGGALRLLPRYPEAASELVRVVAGWIARGVHHPSAPALPDDQRALAEVLALTDVQGREPALVALLANDDEATRIAAATALGAVGTIASVPALLPLRAKFLGGALKEAAQAAILFIQARAAGAESGTLALADEDRSGELALSDATSPEPAEAPESG